MAQSDIFFIEVLSILKEIYRELIHLFIRNNQINKLRKQSLCVNYNYMVIILGQITSQIMADSAFFSI